MKRVSDESPRAALLRGLAVQRRVVGALLMREVITRYGRHNIGVLWLFLEPMIFTIGVIALWTVSGMSHGPEMPVVAFAITGYSSVLLWRNCANCCMGAIDTNMALLYHRQVKVIDIMIARILLEIAGATASFAILSMFFVLCGWMSPPAAPGIVLAGWLMLSWFGASLAIVIGAGTAFGPLVKKLWQPATYLLFPLSGAAFMVHWLSSDMQGFALMIPMVHGVELLRAGYFGDSIRSTFDASYLAAWCLALTCLGLVMLRWAGARVEGQ